MRIALSNGLLAASRRGLTNICPTTSATVSPALRAISTSSNKSLQQHFSPSSLTYIRYPLTSSHRLPTVSLSSLRSFHTSPPTFSSKTESHKKDTKTGQKADHNKTSESENSESKEEAKEESKEESKEDSKEESKEGEKDKPPPPPHGDKTPWQVFTDTLKAEFQQSKEWKEGTQALSSGIDEFNQKESIRKAREVSDAASTKTTEAIKTTGRAIGKGATWTWDTPVVKGVRHSVNAAGRGIEKATRPVRETEAFKNVRDVIDDGSSIRYGGWVEKEERRRLRQERKRAMGDTHPGVEDPEAGTNVTLHKDAKWKESWRDFRDQSGFSQSVSSFKSTYQESDNPLIVTARSITDRFAGFFAENETVGVIKKFREMDPNFKVEPFIQEMREYILPEVLDAYVKGDVEVLKQWLSAAQFSVYSALMKQYTTAGLKSDGRILDIRNVEIANARLLDPGEIPVFIISCRTQEVHVYRKIKSGELMAGMDDNVQQVTYAIGVTRIPEDVSNPETRGWRLIELQKSARNYL